MTHNTFQEYIWRKSTSKITLQLQSVLMDSAKETDGLEPFHYVFPFCGQAALLLMRSIVWLEYAVPTNELCSCSVHVIQVGFTFDLKSLMSAVALAYCRVFHMLSSYCSFGYRTRLYKYNIRVLCQALIQTVSYVPHMQLGKATCIWNFALVRM